MSALLPIIAATEQHELHELWFPAPLFGVIMFALFTVCAAVTYSFRQVAHRHVQKAEAYANAHGGTPQH